MATQTVPALEENTSAGETALVTPESEPKPQPESKPETEPVAESGEQTSLAVEIEDRIAAAPLLLEIRLPIRGLRVKDILALEKEKIFETGWPADEDVPGYCGGVQLVWTEFEVIEKRLAARVTRLA